MVDKQYIGKWALAIAREERASLRRHANIRSLPYNWCPILTNSLDDWFSGYCASRMSNMYQTAMMAAEPDKLHALECEAASAWNEVIFLLGDYSTRRFDAAYNKLKGLPNGRLRY